MLSLGDLRNVVRDPMLVMVFIAPVLITVVLKAGLPFSSAVVSERLGFDLTVHYPFIISMAIPFIPMMVGMMAGFIILEDLDDNLLSYYAVTPVSRAGYILYRMTAPALLSFLFTLGVVLITGFVEVNFLRVMPVLIMASLEAPMIALFLGAFAANRIEGLALSKVIGIFLVAPLPGYLTESPWRLMAGVLPPYWVSSSFLTSMEPGPLFAVYTAAGLIFHAGYIYLLLGRFSRKVL